MSVTKDVETIGIFALIAVGIVLLAGIFKDELAGFAKTLGGIVPGGTDMSNAGTKAGQQIAQGLQNLAAGVGGGLGTAAATVPLSTANGAGDTLGDWLWNGVTTIFPSLDKTTADPSELNYANASETSFAQGLAPVPQDDGTGIEPDADFTWNNEP